MRGKSIIAEAMEAEDRRRTRARHRRQWVLVYTKRKRLPWNIGKEGAWSCRPEPTEEHQRGRDD